MWSQRQLVDYVLQRRNAVAAFHDRNPLRSVDPRDADPMLVRAALNHGEETDESCPICDSTTMVALHYVFGSQLGQYSGRIKSRQELEEMAHEYGEFKVCEVEVCPACSWNFMTKSWLLGDGVRRRPPRKQQTVEDIYG